MITTDEKLNRVLLTFFRRALSPYPGYRFKAGQIQILMEDLKYRQVHEMDADFLKMYMIHGGDVSSCFNLADEEGA